MRLPNTALQAATVLRGKRAVQMSLFVIRAFVKMRACDAPEIASGLACATLKWDAASDFQTSLPPT